ncbi:MAG: hypothetical protein ACOH5I_25485 [Oligoflexus sp.]
MMQGEGCKISPSSVFTVLKANGKVEPFKRREAPWKEPKYEVRARNLIWGKDWTKIKINHETWQLLALIVFSRKVIAWDIQPSINAGHIKAIYSQALAAEQLTHKKQKLK